MHLPAEKRYELVTYARCGRSGLKLPRISLGLWQNFGGSTPFDNAREMLLKSFDAGITHFDLANNYGPPPGSAEENFGRILAADLAAHRDELVISTKAGYLDVARPVRRVGLAQVPARQPGPEPEAHGSRLRRHLLLPSLRPGNAARGNHGRARHGRAQRAALYVGISSYGPEKTREAAAILRELKTPFIIHQPSYSMLNRWVERDLLDVLERGRHRLHRVLAAGPGPAQQTATCKACRTRPAPRKDGSFRKTMLTERNLANVRALNEIAKQRGQSLAQMAIAWVLRKPAVTSALIGASRWAADRGVPRRAHESAVQLRASSSRSTRTRSTAI